MRPSGRPERCRRGVGSDGTLSTIKEQKKTKEKKNLDGGGVMAVGDLPVARVRKELTGATAFVIARGKTAGELVIVQTIKKRRPEESWNQKVKP